MDAYYTQICLISYNMHQCLRCILGHLQWSQSLRITLANPCLAVIELQLFSISVSRDNWSWLQHFLLRLNRFNPNWANPPIYMTHQTQIQVIFLKPRQLQDFWFATNSSKSKYLPKIVPMNRILFCSLAQQFLRFLHDNYCHSKPGTTRRC